ncbi:MAG: tryptophan 7-halogenase [Legionellaceae bacterium]|nr:tryptophan 7-halogenase [Legionellaceae bacterium]
MDDRVRNIVILGGGTAGWMTASYLGKALQGTVNITVLESAIIPKIGVGEATVPNLQKVFFDYLGLKEEDWMPKCNAAFKVAVKFINWKTGGLYGKTDHFYHPFGLLSNCDNIPLTHYWLHKYNNNLTSESFDYACFKEVAIMDGNLSPRWINGEKATRYAWHFDAHLVAEFLCEFSTTTQNVTQIIDDFEAVNFDDKGFINSIITRSGRLIEGDLFIDCSGFRSLLINKALGEPFINMNDQLFCDSAIAAAIPHDDKKYGVEPYTSAIAMKAGWTWKIPMLGRFGSGYVYSSNFSSQENAVDEFCKLWSLEPNNVNLNNIRFRVGRNRRAWVKNCIGIGLSSCFLEPLESTGIYFIYAALYHLVKNFPDRNFDPVLQKKFNQEIEAMFDDTRDFIQTHFYFSPRTDTDFWKANKSLQLTDNIREKISLYRAGVPFNQPITSENNYYENFDAEFRNFWTNGSYYCIFAGLGIVPEKPFPILSYKPESIKLADLIFKDIKTKQRHLQETLPSHYDFLRKLHGQI